jgi:hypothetical protein
MQSLIGRARYGGPFHEVKDFYWRDDLAEILDKVGGDIAKAPELQGAELSRIDEGNLASSAFFCVLTEQPIPIADAAPNPDWIPAGAQLARIQRNLYDQLGPMLSI